MSFIHEIDIACDGKRSELEMALKLVWPHPDLDATHFAELKLPGHGTWNLQEIENGIPTLILLDQSEGKSHPIGSVDNGMLPLPHTDTLALGFICEWLKSAEYGPQPDHDGSNGKGWRIFSNSYSTIAGYQHAICGVQPYWAEYHK